MLTKIKLKDNFDRLNTYDKVMEEVDLTIPYPILLQVDPSATVTKEGALCDWNLEKS